MKTDSDLIIAEHFIKANINEAVQIIEKLEYDAIVEFIQNIPPELAVKVLTQMNNYKAAKCLELLQIDLAAQLIQKFDLSSAELVLAPCNEEFRTLILKRINPTIAGKIIQKFNYAPNSVGSCMKPKVFSLQKNLTILEATELMKKEKELIGSEVFVTDAQSKLKGIVKTSQMLLAEGSVLIADIMNTDTVTFFVDEPINEISDHPGWADYRTIPVTDLAESLVGSLHFEDVSKASLKKDSGLNKQVVETGNALGELYLIGLTGLLQSVGKTE